jgi:predicted nuclease with TOPRIM domain
VAGAWAVAATAIAVIALIVANDNGDEDQSARTSSQITRLERELTQRIDDLDGRIDDLAAADDVARLDNRLKQVEETAGKHSDQLDELDGRLDDLESKVEAAEQTGSGTDTTDTTTTP